MEKKRSIEQYRNIDLTLFAVMLVFSEWLIVRASTRWFSGQLYTVSVAAAITAIVMMRWGAMAAIHAVLAGAVYCFVSGASGQQYLFYCVGNLLGLASLLLIRFLGSERIRNDDLLSLLFALSTQLFMQLGRGLTAMLAGYSFASALEFLTTDALSGLFSMVIIWIARRLDGIFENQKSYLLRLNRDAEEEKGGY